MKVLICERKRIPLRLVSYRLFIVLELRLKFSVNDFLITLCTGNVKLWLNKERRTKTKSKCF